jgi:hypothetical protein
MASSVHGYCGSHETRLRAPRRIPGGLILSPRTNESKRAGPSSAPASDAPTGQPSRTPRTDAVPTGVNLTARDLSGKPQAWPPARRCCPNPDSRCRRNGQNASRSRADRTPAGRRELPDEAQAPAQPRAETEEARSQTQEAREIGMVSPDLTLMLGPQTRYDGLSETDSRANAGRRPSPSQSNQVCG